jgi:hypothetical protein
MKRALALIVVLTAGCHTKPAPVALHPHGSSTPDCYPVKEMAATVHTETPEKAHVGFPSCPDDMRIALPSERQMRIFYPKADLGAGWDLYDRLDAQYTHSTCIPDGLGARP